MLVGLGNQRSYRPIYIVSKSTVHVLSVGRAEQDES